MADIAGRKRLEFRRHDETRHVFPSLRHILFTVQFCTNATVFLYDLHAEVCTTIKAFKRNRVQNYVITWGTKFVQQYLLCRLARAEVELVLHEQAQIPPRTEYLGLLKFGPLWTNAP